MSKNCFQRFLEIKGKYRDIEKKTIKSKQN